RPLPTRFPACGPGSALLLLAVLAFAAALGGQCRNERLLRHFDAAHHLHALLAFLLLLQQLALPADVTAVALGEHVLAKRADILPGDDPGTDRGLDRHLELLPGDEFPQLLRHLRTVGVGVVAVHDRGERV